MRKRQNGVNFSCVCLKTKVRSLLYIIFLNMSNLYNLPDCLPVPTNLRDLNVTYCICQLLQSLTKYTGCLILVVNVIVNVTVNISMQAAQH